ncbi:OmpA family protein [Luteolibacter pohnpeiensis]|uniref:OmpA family protein n=1 Tax=Luteolibacter pohnpeiensis TaxID=454153 RepID=A0A934S7R0_9BACT|nr:OmpA family protein [Luteolibacter pohnpeiensis]MBK1882764.1 OmpA family protein [Luteolibacter pohnpeiensis]
MARNNTWENVLRETHGRSREPSRLGWWAAVAMILSLLLHVLVFFALDRIQIALGIQDSTDLETGPVIVQNVEETPRDFPSLPPTKEVEIPKPDMTSMLEDVDILQALPKDQELEMRPDVEQEKFAIEMADPVAASGSPDAPSIDISSGMDLDSNLPELGKMEDTLIPGAIGQVTIDPGSIQADDLQLSGYTDELLKKGANGKVEKGTLDGLASLDDLLGLPANELVGKKTMLPSDLLFEFNSSELRESAKVGLMKLGMLIDLNPDLYCWIEGYTDLVGSDSYNLELSKKRADAVKNYLVKSLRMKGDRIITRGFGKASPLVTGGDVDQQAPNRRVEIRMRKNAPPPEVKIEPTPTPETEVSQAPEPQPETPPKAILVKPNKTYPDRQVIKEPVPPRAVPVEENQVNPAAPESEPVPPKAQPVEDPDTVPPRATPVEEEESPTIPPKAVPVEEP